MHVHAMACCLFETLMPRSFCRRHFRIQYSWMKMLYFPYNSTEICSHGSKWQYQSSLVQLMFFFFSIRQQAIIWTNRGLDIGRINASHRFYELNNAELLLIGTVITNFSETLIKYKTFSSMRLKRSSAGWRSIFQATAWWQTPSKFQSDLITEMAVMDERYQRVSFEWIPSPNYLIYITSDSVARKGKTSGLGTN